MNLAIYLDKKARDKSISESIVFASEIILSSVIIKDLLTFKDAFERSQKGNISPDEYKKIISPFIFESYVDAFKICTYFENYSKAILLMKGYLIHIIRNNYPYSNIYTRQRKEPCPLKDFISHGTSSRNVSPEYLLNEGLRNNTLSPSTMFQPSYRKVIGLPDEIFETVKYLTDKRNEVHFLNDWQIIFSMSFLRSLESIISFVRKQITIK